MISCPRHARTHTLTWQGDRYVAEVQYLQPMPEVEGQDSLDRPHENPVGVSTVVYCLADAQLRQACGNVGQDVLLELLREAGP